MKGKGMKRRSTKVAVIGDDMLREYDFTGAKPNRFAQKAAHNRGLITLDPDVRRYFTNSRAVNSALRALISAIPSKQPRRRATVSA
jgi:hypothetical protein